MSETAEQRTKRTYVKHLHAYPWLYQYSVMYKSIAEFNEALVHSIKLKRNVSRAFKTPLLYRLQLKGGLPIGWFNDGDVIKGKRTVVAPYHSFYSTEVLDLVRLTAIASRVVCDPKIKHRALTAIKLESVEAKIEAQKPHDLANYFGKSHIQRFSLLNK